MDSFPTVVEICALGVFGSIGVEVAAALRDVTLSDGELPKRFKTLTYPVIRILFAFVGAGPLAVLLASKPD